MKTVSVSEAKGHLSELLEHVLRGRTVLIVRRGHPIARLAPVEATGDLDERREARLQRDGILRPPERPPQPDLAEGVPGGTENVDLLAALLAGREEER